MQEQAVWALGNIAGDCDEFREMILDSGGFTQIAMLADQNLDKVGIVKNCIWCLSNLCRYQKRDAVFSYFEPCLPFLQKMFVYNRIEVVTDVCWAFSFLTYSASPIKKVVMQFIDPLTLMNYIIHCNTCLLCPALRIAGNIVSGDKEDTQKMLDVGLIPVLKRILPEVNDLQKKEILWIFSNIAAGTPKQIKAMIDYGVVSDLIRNYIIPTGIDMLQVEALWVITNMITGGTKEQVEDGWLNEE